MSFDDSYIREHLRLYSLNSREQRKTIELLLDNISLQYRSMMEHFKIMDKRITILDTRLEHFGKQMDLFMDGNTKLVQGTNMMIQSQDNILTNIIPVFKQIVDSQKPVKASVPKCRECK